MTSQMSARLSNKTVLITGASSGIGKSCALEFAATAAQDLKLVLTARRHDALKEIATSISAKHGSEVKVHIAQLDVSVPEQIAVFVQSLPEEFRDVDILVNNAGLALGMDQAPNIKPSDLSTMMSTNVLGLINTTQAILSIMKSRGAKGSGDIINIGSIAGRTPYAGGSVYCASKAAVRSFTDALRKELAETRIRVMEIDPGKVQTEFSTVRFYGDQEKADGVYKAFEPLTPGDVAELVVFAAGRRENVVIADALICPNHQAV